MIKNIIEKYNMVCPDRFELDVAYYGYKKEEKFEVYCEGKSGYDICQDGYEKSYYDKFSDRDPGYFGCVKYASCQETKSEYSDWGRTKCLECNAGGCVDYERWVELGGAICKVNFKEPSKTPPCKAYEE
jgi:hypothetical protein